MSSSSSDLENAVRSLAGSRVKRVCSVPGCGVLCYDKVCRACGKRVAREANALKLEAFLSGGGQVRRLESVGSGSSRGAVRPRGRAKSLVR